MNATNQTPAPMPTANQLLKGNSFAHLRSSMEVINACSMVSITDLQGTIQYANDRFCTLMGYDPHELVGQKYARVKSGLTSLETFEALWQTLQAGKVWQGDICNRDKQGRLHWLDTTICPVTDGSGHVVRYLAIHHDVTFREALNKQTSEARARLDQLLAMSMDWYWEMDEQFRFMDVTTSNILPSVQTDQFVGKTRWDAAVPGDEDVWRTHRELLQAHLPFRDFEYRITVTGTLLGWRWCTTSGEPLFDDDGIFKGYRGIARDITQQREERETLWRTANLDALTGLPNRRNFVETLALSLKGEAGLIEPFALAFLDVDGFSAINDTMGHATGDELLCIVSQRLRTTVRETDMVARLDGDEFAIIYPGIKSHEDLRGPMNKLLRAIEAPIAILGKVRCSVSIGVALYPTAGDNAQDLSMNAGIALNSAKGLGSSQYTIFTPEHKFAVDRKAQRLNDIEEALNSNRIMLHYQPVVDPQTRSVVALEALLRWDHPQLGMLSAGSFMDVFDNMSLAHRIGLLVTDMAVNQAAKWRKQQVPFCKIGINVTSADFLLGDYPGFLANRLAMFDVPPQNICIEVTEGMFLGTAAHKIIQGMQTLHEMGVELAFDDFGTGYASLTHLKLPFDRLKIDKSFVSNIENDQHNGAIIEAVVSLGNRLGKHITVEGVETQQQAKILHEMGCNQFQGFLFSKPLPAKDIAGFISGFKTTAPKP